MDLRRHPGALLSALVAAATLAAAPLHAEEAVTGTEAEAEAMALYAQGEEHYTAGRYDEALSAFKQAYQRLPTPLLLVNIGQCFRQLGDHGNAVRALERYLADEPEADNRAEVEELIAAERALLPKPAAPPPTAQTAAAAPKDRGGEEGAPDNGVLWMAVGGAALALAVGGVVTVAVLAAQPAPLQPAGSLGTWDLR